MATHPDDIKVVSSEEETKTEEVVEYWTEEVMALAEPIEAPVEEEEELLALMAPAPWKQEGTPMVMESAPADGDSVEDEEDAAAPLSGFTTRRAAQSDNLPYATVGKMFMVFDDKNYVGTGWVVAERAVFTAGHCVYSAKDGGWADKILFVPQYDNGSAPVGRWTATTIYSLKGWTGKRDFKYDMGVFVTDRLIRPETGSLGWMANYPPNQGPYKSIGYPARPVPGYSFNGKHMWQSIGGFIRGSNPIQMHNNMTQGCSGGPWTVTRNRRIYANGLNSFRHRDEPNTMHSPYFGDGFIHLYDAVKDEG